MILLLYIGIFFELQLELSIKHAEAHEFGTKLCERVVHTIDVDVFVVEIDDRCVDVVFFVERVEMFSRDEVFLVRFAMTDIQYPI